MESEAVFHVLGRVVSGKVLDDIGYLTIAINGSNFHQGASIRESRFVNVVFPTGQNWVRSINRGNLVRIKGDLVQDNASSSALKAVARRYTSILATDEEATLALEGVA